mmetsp:Transcript_40249/g.38719  ORF Transcript_40249/g.38719 Transcript_40249/m.38719 type:complete len:183 (+) Transcript_40249:346-894(+)
MELAENHHKEIKYMDEGDVLEFLEKELVLLKDISNSLRPSLEDIERRASALPYHRVIQKLKELKNHKNPLKKAKVISEARELIPVSIDEFWRGLLEPNTKQKKLVLDADQMVSILTYAIIQTKEIDFPAQIKLTEEFTSEEVQNSKIGQALFTLKAATDNVAKGIINPKRGPDLKWRSITKC